MVELIRNYFTSWNTFVMTSYIVFLSSETLILYNILDIILKKKTGNKINN